MPGAYGNVSECDPRQAWNGLESNPDAQLVDVRTRPEWSFVGIPDLSSLNRQAVLIEWRQFPSMSVNPNFAEDVLAALGGALPDTLYFICRSGARSMEAAIHVSDVFDQRGRKVQCVNVAEGFEGDLDHNRHRGTRNGWKARHLAWLQS